MVPVTGLGAVDSLWTSDHHFCALSNGGETIRCWGQNSYGHVSGLPGAEFEALPVDISDWFDRPLRAVYPGWRATCVEDVDGQLSCWGLNNDGILAVPGPDLTATENGAGMHDAALDIDGRIVERIVGGEPLETGR